MDAEKTMRTTVLPISEIKIGKFERREMVDDEDMDDLVASIRRVGVLQPLVVRQVSGEVVLIAGHRRYRACQIAGIVDIPVVVRSDTDAEAVEAAFAENLFRKDMSPIEVAAGLKDCLEEGTMGIEDLARAMHRSVEWVRKMVAMCDWPGDVTLAIHQGWVSVSAGANLAMVEEDKYRAFLLEQASQGGCTARVTAAWLQAWRALKPCTEAVQAEPLPPGGTLGPMIPQLPCFVCGATMRMDALSHVPVCGGCVMVLKEAGKQMLAQE